MESPSDAELLAEYAANNSDAAFTKLVERHSGLVYSAALRKTNDPYIAEEITQTVFIILARKAARLGRKTVLPGWLCRTAHLAGRNALRMQYRRLRREQNAAQTDGADAEHAWQQLAPILDEAVTQLRETDRNAIVLRYYQQYSLEEVGAALGIGADAAQKRVSRALEKLRGIFAKRGVLIGTTVLAGLLTTHVVQAAPASLVASIVATAAGVTISTVALVRGTLNALAWARYKAPLAYGTVILLVLTSAFIILPRISNPSAANNRRSTLANSTRTNQAFSPTVLRELLDDRMKIGLESPAGSVAIQPDGKIIVGTTLFGGFVDEQSNTVGLFTRGAFRLNADGSLDRTFLCDVKTPASITQMSSLAMLPDGRIFITGAFGRIDDKPRPNVAILLPDGSVDESFQPWNGTTNPPPAFFAPTVENPTVWGRPGYQWGDMPAALLADHSVAIVCRPLRTNRYISPPWAGYRLDPSGRLIEPESNILAGNFSRPSGLMLTLGPAGFYARNKSVQWTNNTPAAPRPPIRYGTEIVSLENSPPVWDFPFDNWRQAPSAPLAAKVLQALFEEVPIELCRYAARLPDGGAILAVRDAWGDYKAAPGRFMQFDSNWIPDFSFTNQFVADTSSCSLSLKRQSDGKLLVAGLVGKINGEDCPGLVRLNPDGQTDHTFHCETENSANGRVMDLAVQPDGRIVICGYFSKVNGVGVPHIARLNPDGSLDPSFHTPFTTAEKFAEFRRKWRVSVTKLVKNNPPAAKTPSAAASSVLRPSSETILITSLRLEPNGAIITFTGNPNQTYVLQAKDSVNSGDWSTLSTNSTTSKGQGVFQDPEAYKHPTRFYRIATP